MLDAVGGDVARDGAHLFARFDGARARDEDRWLALADEHACDVDDAVVGRAAARREVTALLLRLPDLHAGLEDLLEDALDGGGIERPRVGCDERLEHLLLARGVVL